MKLSYMKIQGLGMGLGALNSWAWPEKADILCTPIQDILVRGISVEPRNSRGCFSVKESDVKKDSDPDGVVNIPVPIPAPPPFTVLGTGTGTGNCTSTGTGLGNSTTGFSIVQTFNFFSIWCCWSWYLYANHC